MTDKNDWQNRVGASWASEWKRTDRSFGGLTDRLIGAASAGGVSKALDIGCGAGELSLAMARGHSGADIVGIDISTQLIDAAKERGQHLANLSFELADAARWTPDDFAPDVLFSRHGVMFFDEPVAAFQHLANIAAENARLVFSCFRAADQNPWAKSIMELLPSEAITPPTPRAPGPFAFAEEDYVSGILSEAGWADISCEPVDYAYIAGAGENAVDDALSYFLSIGPAARAATGLDDSERARFVSRLRSYLATNLEGDIVALPAAAWIVRASRALL